MATPRPSKLDFRRDSVSSDSDETVPTSALIRPNDARASSTAQAIHYARVSTSLASFASSMTFLIAKNGTHLGFALARGFSTTAISVASSYTELGLLGTRIGCDRIINYAVRKSINIAEAIAVFPIDVTETVANASLVVASSTIEGISILLGIPRESEDDYQFSLSYTEPAEGQDPTTGQFFGPFSSTAQSFTSSIPSLIRILHHEWHNPRDADHLPGESFSALSIGRSLLAWASIQNVTRIWHEQKWLRNMKEIDDWEWRGLQDPRANIPRMRVETNASRFSTVRSRRSTVSRKRLSSVHVISDVQLPDKGGELLTAEIGDKLEAPVNASSRLSHASFSRLSFMSSSSGDLPQVIPDKVPYPVLRHALRRFSRMVLGGYGGAGMVLFGVQIPSLLKAGSLTAGFNEDGKSFKVGYVAPSETRARSTATTPGAVTPLEEMEQPKFNLDVNLPSFTSRSHIRGEASFSSLEKDSIPFPGSPQSDWDAKSTLELVVEGAEQSDEDEDESSAWDMLDPPSPEHSSLHRNPSIPDPDPTYSWWNLLLGKHDKEVFDAFATTHPSMSPFASTANLPMFARQQQAKKRATLPRKSLPPSSHAVDTECLPRFWVLTDHGRQQIVLVLRGTMTLNEVAIDLACDATPFLHAKTPDSSSGTTTPSLGRPQFSTVPEHTVHQGMYALAKLTGSVGRPVHDAVAQALEQNEAYELVLCGHSLGAGVCALLGLMWADPETCLTVASGGLPEGRPVSVFCFAPPCVMSPALSQLSSSLITSFVYSHDLVTRLSLGAVRDLKRVTSWLCYGQTNGSNSKESPSSIIQRALMFEKGFSFLGIGADKEAERAWFLSLRKTLEANMQYADLFPPGRIIWALPDHQFDVQNRKHNSTGSQTKQADQASSPNSLRVFEVQRVDEVFGQVVFAKDMLSSHFVQNYDSVLHDFL